MALTSSSFLGSNSEVLIHAAFDVAPPTPAAALPAIAAAAATDPEAAGAAAQPDTAAAGKKQRDKPSALGKLFNKNDRNAAPTVTITAAEWDEVRASQKRLEEMLAKIAAVSGV
jgi:hypothetical protein